MACLPSDLGDPWCALETFDDKTFCSYLAENEDRIHEHAAKSCFSASRVIEIVAVVDLATELCWLPCSIGS